MSTFTYEDFQRVAQQVAEHISKKSGLVLGEKWSRSRDSTWEAKRVYVNQVFFRFSRVVLLAGDRSRRCKDRSGLIFAMESPAVVNCQNNAGLLWSSDPKDQWNNPEKSKTVFDLFVSEYKPPDDNNELFDHLLSLHYYYTEIGRHIKTAHPSIPQRIDFAMIMATGRALEKIGFEVRTAFKTSDRTDRSTQAIQKKWFPQDDKIQHIVDNVKPRLGLSRNARIKIYQKAWPEHYEGEAPPSRAKFHQFFKDRGLE